MLGRAAGVGQIRGFVFLLEIRQALHGVVAAVLFPVGKGGS